jgi:hypothetical protein
LATHLKKSIRIIGFSLLGIILVGGVATGISLLQPDSKIHNAFAKTATNSRFIFWEAAVDGISETEAAPGSASKIITRYFGNELRTDLDGDDVEDIAFILTQSSGGLILMGVLTLLLLKEAINQQDSYKHISQDIQHLLPFFLQSFNLFFR